MFTQAEYDALVQSSTEEIERRIAIGTWGGERRQAAEAVLQHRRDRDLRDVTERTAVATAALVEETRRMVKATEATAHATRRLARATQVLAVVTFLLVALTAWGAFR